ncbi:hypothetical protein N781_08745 [Pontibacillus halophilus JSM 076056 = DSM 19796]|uniref:Polysaccharide polymerase n=1 Tax=Pontibacillus halophilus JSM 076056 = DSM 19796 TaxID=1385510 RepID=A0A0A5I2B6_9BACI|nr:hypothetical protein [Pontibacillus halophilus]KGX89982.1 hypothetical protein N781_08745 [Pontibacillus halophilus JSM 076056 = DSM 19796]
MEYRGDLSEKKINILIYFCIAASVFLPVMQVFIPSVMYKSTFSFLFILWALYSLNNNNYWIKKNLHLHLFAFFILFQILFYELLGFSDINLINLVPTIFFIVSAYVGYFYLNLNDQDVDKSVIKITTILVIITSITTIWGLMRYPNAVRSLTSTSQDKDMQQTLYAMNISSFDFTYSLVIVLPLLFIMLLTRTKKYYPIWEKFIVFCISLLFLVVIFNSKFLISYILLGMSFLVSLFSVIRNTFFSAILITISSILILFISPTLIVFMLDIISNNTDSLLIINKIATVKQIIESGYNLSLIGSRYDYFLLSFSSFVDSPIFGVGAYYKDEYTLIGGHSQLMDDLARYGIVGFVLYMGLMIGFIRNNINKLRHYKIKNAMFYSYVIFFLLNFLNPARSFIFSLLFFILIPALGRYVDKKFHY